MSMGYPPWTNVVLNVSPQSLLTVWMQFVAGVRHVIK